jgi:DASH complex subunit DAM1
VSFSLELHLGRKERTDVVVRTTDTSFVENPPASSKASSKYSTPAPNRTRGGRGGGGAPPRGGGIPRASGIARGVSSRGRGKGASATGRTR